VVSIIGLLLAVGLVFLFYSRNQVRQQLIESELKNKRLESEKLKEELEFKQKDLTNFALDIARKNEFSQKIHDGLHLIHGSNNVDFRKDKIKELLILTSNHLKVNDDIREFQMNVETVNQDFFNRLTEQFPDLTSTDKQLCGLLRLNLSTKDIASIRNISPKSVEMSRYRLRKKLNLSAQDEMTSFLQQL
jgi:DNA-binding CsgD family transcriptional regulator